MTTVYLAGPMDGCTEEELHEWRDELKAKCETAGIQTLDPTRRDFRGCVHLHTSDIVEGDKADIQNSDFVVVNYWKKSTGTSMELMYAYELGIPVITIVRGAMSDVNPWITYHSKQVVHTIDEAFEYILANTEEQNSLPVAEE